MRRARIVLVALISLAACTSGSTSSSTPTSSASASVSSGPSSATPTTSGSAGETDWLTYHRDNARTGFDPNPPNALGSARKAWTSPELDGAVYAQPLLFGNR